jgi:nitroreductase
MQTDQMSTDVRAVLENIANRRSCPYKKLKTDPISKETLNQLFEAANWAPTHRFTEPWRFSVFTGDAKRTLANAIIEAYRRHISPDINAAKESKILDRCQHVPVILNIAMEPCYKNKLPEYEEILAVGCAVQNLHLAAFAMGISGLWSTPQYLEDPKLRQFLQLEDQVRNFGFFYLGYHDGELPSSKRRPIDEKVRWFD